MSESDLNNLRQNIDDLDEKIVQLLNERAAHVVKIGKAKKASGQVPIYAPDREQRVLARVRKANDGPLPNACLEAIWRELMSGSFALESPLKIGYLGPAGSFSHLAAMKQFGKCVDYESFESITNVFHGMESNRVSLALIPVENSTGGGIHESLDCFLQTSARVCAEVLVPIHHHLLSRCSDESQIKCLYSRPEVFEQCRKWLSEHLRSAERIATTSSARAAEIVSKEEGAASISAEIASDLYDVPILQQNIEDNPNNVTRFFVIGHQSSQPTGDDKTSVLFTTAHQPGALAAVINTFRDNSVNLTHIDKRPSQRTNWEYYFFVDCVGHSDEPNVTAALEASRPHCLQLTVLGSFPRAVNVLE
jgi:chorismate mutase/prephenate dehydratase